MTRRQKATPPGTDEARIAIGWTRTSIYCYESSQNCAGCDLPSLNLQVLQKGCPIGVIIPKILDLIGPPLKTIQSTDPQFIQMLCDYVGRCPGSTTREIGKAFGRSDSTMSGVLSRLQHSGMMEPVFKQKVHPNGKVTRTKTWYLA